MRWQETLITHSARDLETAAHKLASIDLSQAETEAVAAYLSSTSEAEVAGFGFDPANISGPSLLSDLGQLVKRSAARRPRHVAEDADTSNTN